jgi:transposase
MGRDRFDHRVDHSDISSRAGRQRIEVITGPERRRRWSAAEKQAMVAESFEDGAVVSAIARRHGISPQQLFGWRAKARAGMPAETAPEPALFAPVLVESATAGPSAPDVPRAPEEPSIEIVIGNAVVRIRGAVDGRTLAMVLKALKVLT